jgi:hypothetical protein
VTTAQTLSDQIGIDTVRKLEAAVPWRLQDAEVLRLAGRRLAAIYLYGYVVEMLLGAAYFRLIRYGPDTDITARPENLQRSRPGKRN